MSFFNFFSARTPVDKANRLKRKITQKYGDALTRQKAIDELGRLKSPDTVQVLMQRFAFAVEPQTTDADEKQTVFDYIRELGPAAVPNVQEFLVKTDTAASWAIRILDAILSQSEVIGIVTDELNRLGAEYTRDPAKKEVLLHYLEGKVDDRIGPATLPFMNDMSDDVKLCALKTIASVKYEPARQELLQLLIADETAKRVQLACIAALIDTGFHVHGFREKVEARLSDGTYLDRSGIVKKRR